MVLQLLRYGWGCGPRGSSFRVASSLIGQVIQRFCQLNSVLYIILSGCLTCVV